MTLYHVILRIIDFASFSSVWYWIVLAGLWILRDRKILEIPANLILEARAEGKIAAKAGSNLTDAGPASRAVQDWLVIVLRHARWERGQGQMWRIARNWCLGTIFVLLAFVYRIELAQAVLLLLAPWGLANAQDRRLMAKLSRADLDRLDLPRILLWHRFKLQILGMVAIFATVLIGLIHNVT